MSSEQISCDLQPVHAPGSIQPCGALIAADGADDTIVFGSQNLPAWLSRSIEDVLGRPLGEVLGGEQLRRLKQRDLRPASPETLRPFECTIAASERTSTLDALVHAHQGHTVLELFDHTDFALPLADAERFRRRLLAELRRPDTLQEICTVLARTFRFFTAFDRVMVYRFHEDWHGEVVAEDSDRGDRFLGLHFPATDIPEPVRQNYLASPLRLIADAAAAPIPVAPDVHPQTGQSLDLTHAKLRSVAPTHVRYLENMDVRATLSIALLVSGELWGLVACHHYEPKLLAVAQLQLCDVIAQMGAGFIERIRYSSRLRTVTAARELTEALDGRVRDGAPLAAVLADEASTLNEVVPHDGLVIAMDGAVSQIACHFAAPPPFSELIAWVDHRVLVSDSFGRMISLSRSEREAAAGGAFLALSEDGNEWVTLVRRNYPRVVNWGGGKESEGQVDDAGVLHLSPRRSFALWQERVDGQCIPFTPDEREALTLLQRTLSSLRATEREQAARQAQQAAERREADLRFELMQTARLTSMTELASAVAHELNQPLTAVMNYITASRELLRPHEASVPPDVVALIEDGFEQAERAAEIVRRLRAFIARGELQRSLIDLPATMTEAARLALPTRAGDDLQVGYDFAKQLPAISADRVQIQQVVLNLVRNALEAMAQQAERRLELGARAVGPDLVEAWVSDTGPGIAPELMGDLFRPLVSRKAGGMGIGLSLCRSIIEAHGGRIEARNAARGAEVRFALPVAPIGTGTEA